MSSRRLRVQTATTVASIGAVGACAAAATAAAARVQLAGRHEGDRRIDCIQCRIRGRRPRAGLEQPQLRTVPRPVRHAALDSALLAAERAARRLQFGGWRVPMDRHGVGRCRHEPRCPEVRSCRRQRLSDGGGGGRRQWDHRKGVCRQTCRRRRRRGCWVGRLGRRGVFEHGQHRVRVAGRGRVSQRAMAGWPGNGAVHDWYRIGCHHRQSRRGGGGSGRKQGAAGGRSRSCW